MSITCIHHESQLVRLRLRAVFRIVRSDPVWGVCFSFLLLLDESPSSNAAAGSKIVVRGLLLATFRRGAARKFECSLLPDADAGDMTLNFAVGLNAEANDA